MKFINSNTKNVSKIILCFVFAFSIFGFKSTNIKLETTNQSQKENSLIGKWITDDKDVIEFYQNKNIFEGKIVSLGDAAVVKKNPEIIGAVIFKKLELVKGEFINGSYYDIESKDSYKVSIKIVSAKVIKLKFGSGLFSQTSEFKKVN